MRLTQVEAARTALEIERHRLRTGSLPQSLSDLPPAFLAKHGMDVCSGKRLVYKHEGENYMVYGVGLDKHDDGGRPSLNPGSTSTASSGDYIFRVGEMPVPGMGRTGGR